MLPMQGREQKISKGSSPSTSLTESKRVNGGVQTCYGIAENNLVEVQFTDDNLLDLILSPSNMNLAYKRVVSNGGACGVDSMSTDDLLPYLKEHKENLIDLIKQGRYKPQPVLRVEIPKGDGKFRALGIPTVLDRMLQQSISQVLSSIYEPHFSNSSFGFRPRRGAHQALRSVQQYVESGCSYCVDLDLERFFDTVNHSYMMELLSRRIKDRRLLSLIHKYLRAGVVVGGKFERSEQGTPQGGNLSPLLSNILLNELDVELERRGHRFARYADDCIIFCKSERAAQRIKESITQFIEEKLHLNVNAEKTTAGHIRGKKFLGYGFYGSKGKCHLIVHKSSKEKLRRALKKLTKRSYGYGYERRKEVLHSYISGWVAYYRLARMRDVLRDIDGWLRRRIRMCIWKSWKRIKTKQANLYRLGVEESQSWQHANTRLKYWRVAGSQILMTTLTDERLRLAGYPTLTEYYRKLHRN